MSRLLIIFLIFLCACGKIKNKADKIIEQNKDKIINELREPVIINSSIFEKFPEFKAKKFKIDLDKGIKCEYLPSFYKYYFTYIGDKNEILSFISHIKCSYSEILPDTICNRIDLLEFQKKISGLTELEKERAAFFLKIGQSNEVDLELYDCIKTPEHHFIIFDRKAGQIYHMIESFKE
jgi:hypothetical protein